VDVDNDEDKGFKLMQMLTWSCTNDQQKTNDLIKFILLDEAHNIHCKATAGQRHRPRSPQSVKFILTSEIIEPSRPE
jgi:hypothetical protein